MLRIIIEDMPDGRAENAVVLGVVDIADISASTKLGILGDYKVAVFEPNKPAIDLTPNIVVASGTDIFQMLHCVHAGGWKELCRRAFDRIEQLHNKEN